jgi:hypothetical protein
MIADRHTFPARLEPDEGGRLVVHFPDLPEALTDGADVAEASPKPPIACPKRWPAESIMARGSRCRAGRAAGNTWCRRMRPSR